MKRIQWFLALVLVAAWWPSLVSGQTPTPTATPTVTPTPTITPTPTPTMTPTATPTPGGGYGRIALTPLRFGVQTLAPLANVSGARTVTWTAADTTWFDAAVSTGREILLVRNTHATDDGTVTIMGVADAYGRTANITDYVIHPGDVAFFGPLSSAGFLQANGKFWFSGSAATIEFAVVRLP